MTSPTPTDYASADQTFAVAVAATRRLRGLTQEQVAEAMVARGFDYHQQTIWKVENWKRKVPLGEALALADVLDVTVGDLVGGQHELRSLIGSHPRARQELSDAIENYASLLVRTAAAADEQAGLDEGTAEWLEGALLASTPFELAARATYAADALVDAEGLEGDRQFLHALMQKLEQDVQAILAARG